MLQSLNLKPNSKLTKFQLKPESAHWPQLISQYLLAQQVLIHPKLTSSTLWISPPRSTKVKSKSPKISRSAPKERKSKLRRLLYSRSSIWSHSNMVLNSEPSTMMDQSSLKKSSTSTQPHSSPKSKMVLETSQVSHLLLDIQLKPQSHSLSPMDSETLLLCHSNQGTIYFKYRFKIPELDALTQAPQPAKEAPKKE